MIKIMVTIRRILNRKRFFACVIVALIFINIGFICAALITKARVEKLGEDLDVARGMLVLGAETMGDTLNRGGKHPDGYIENEGALANLARGIAKEHAGIERPNEFNLVDPFSDLPVTKKSVFSLLVKSKRKLVTVTGGELRFINRDDGFYVLSNGPDRTPDILTLADVRVGKIYDPNNGVWSGGDIMIFRRKKYSGGNVKAGTQN